MVYSVHREFIRNHYKPPKCVDMGPRNLREIFVKDVL